MDEMTQAYHELDRIQGIVGRHEGHMFSLRGWLFATLAGIVAAYYSTRLPVSLPEFVIVVVALIVSFIYAELRHVILVDALVARAGTLEKMIIAAIGPSTSSSPWYDGPRINDVCDVAVRQVFPSLNMTLLLNLFFYYALLAAVIVLVWLLPRAG